ncbi:hypothetical protein AZI86_11015 [Bdellovibrio bacteriovorus]|uniref:AMP-dependent synthetase/ligase domain-containing protein n=1 Tax=Bdellovibrio bacteriovorus TaxID=959 RepID=A0A150WL52_BDEBC|nr:AMP-binding protein [Bdellovibrio bacteriovorus]KYG64731.1 hypothetical protein AZI86_11015 [Bdellovibrio bacteriovorus]
MILNQILENIKRSPQATAFVFDERHYTYFELGEKIQEIASFLSGRKNERIGVLAQQDFLTYATILGVLFSGNTFVPILSSQPPEKNKNIIVAAEIRFLFFSDIEAKDVFKDLTINFVNSNELVDKSPSPGVYPEQIAYILFTSGSTGVPKGVPISIGNLESFFDAHAKLGLHLSASDRFLQMFDFSFDLSVVSYLLPLLVGGSVYPLKSGNAKYLSVYKTLKDERITYALMVPSIINFLRPYLPRVSFPELRYSTFCGEALLEQDLSLWKKSCANAEHWNFYGPTEATIYCAAFECSTPSARNGILAIGKPMAHTKLMLIDDSENVVEGSGCEGQLCLGGAQVTPGYLDPENTKKAFFKTSSGERFYKTGDIAIRDAAGDYFFCGRVDQQVKIQGFRVELGEIENACSKICAKSTVAVFEHDNHGNAVVAVFVEAAVINEQQLKVELSQILPEYAIPRKIFAKNSFPLNINGKIDRKFLKQEFKDWIVSSKFT